MKLLDYTGEDALDLLADIMDPVSEILSDTQFRDVVRSGASTLAVVKSLLKNHKSQILAIMARVEDTSPEEYKPNVFTLPVKLVELINSEEFQELFQLQGQKKGVTSSGSAMVSIGAAENE